MEDFFSKLSLQQCNELQETVFCQYIIKLGGFLQRGDGEVR